MHKRFVANIIARIVLFSCVTMFLPLAWALHDDIHSREVMAFLVSILIGTLASLMFLFKFKIQKVDYHRINTKDGLAIVGLSWVFLSIFGALPLYFSGVVEHFTDAFFEIVSGYTTTGATIFSNVEVLPRGILFWRSLTHWLGGMGIIVLYIALLPALGVNAFQLYKAEAPGLTVERVDPLIKETAKKLWFIYFVLSLAQVILYLIGGMPIFDSLCHTFGTIATGGFSTKNASIGAYSPYIQWVTIVFMILAGINFILHFQFFKGKPFACFKNEEFRMYCFIILGAIPIFYFLLFNREHLTSHPFVDSVFQIVSILTTTGYGTSNFVTWPSSLKFILVMFMFIGGCGGSTSGGVKLIRFCLSIKIAYRSIMQAVFPNAVMPIRINSKALTENLVLAVGAYFNIFLSLLFIGAGIFTVLESCDLVTSVTAVLSALSNIGPGLSRVGPMENFGWVSPPGKWLLTFMMLAGRLELYSILILFVPSTWRK